jgi:hypothetical protein
MSQSRLPWALTFAFILAQAVLLWWLGRVPICTCGYVKFWHGVTMSSENSQHLTDWYTPSHVIHGILFYAGLHYLAPRLSVAWRLSVATLIEAAWEVLENTDAVIDRYRAVTISLDYYGDSIINSVADTVAAVIGFGLARVAPVWVSVAVVIGFEALTTWWIRDGLALNILMLVWPVKAVLDWQGGV